MMEAKSRPEPQIITSSSDKTATSACIIHNGEVKDTGSSATSPFALTGPSTNANEGKEQERAATLSPSIACASKCYSCCSTTANMNTSTTASGNVSVIASADIPCAQSTSNSPLTSITATNTASSSCSLSSSSSPATLSSPSKGIDTTETSKIRNATKASSNSASIEINTTTSTSTMEKEAVKKEPPTKNDTNKPPKDNAKVVTKSKKARQKQAQNLSNEMEIPPSLALSVDHQDSKKGKKSRQVPLQMEMSSRGKL